MRPGLPLALLAAGCFLPACHEPRREASARPAVDSAEVARARAAASDLGSDLMAMLTRELARGGPAAAIAVCADSAQQRTLLHQREGLMVRRVGTRVRNPGNTPDSLETAVLAAFAASLGAGRLPADTLLVEALPGGGRELRYLRPIRIQAQCLACHGPEAGLAPGVRQLLAARYPGDRATGYAVGDLRGAVSVRLSLPDAPAN
jgi:hypothetical protein